MASADSEITTEAVKKIFNEYNPQLVQYLPLKDYHFIAQLTQQHLFSAPLKKDVMESTKSAEAATIFLVRAVEHPLSNADREPFDKLLLVMEKFDDSTLNKLAKEIKHKLGHTQQRDSPDNFDCPTALKNLKENYDEMTYLPINSMLGKLYSKNVITLKEKDKIKISGAAESDRMEYFLDRIIIPSLKVNVSIKLKGLLEVMEESGDSTLISMAKQLIKHTVTEVAADQNQMITPEHSRMSLQSPADESPYMNVNVKKFKSVSVDVPPPLPPRTRIAKNLQSPDDKSTCMNVNVMKFKSVSADVPPPVPPHTRIAKNTKKLPVQEPTKQFKGTKLSKPMKESELLRGRSSTVPPPVAPRPKQGAHHFLSSEGVKQSRADESPIQKLANQFKGAKMSKPVKESPSFAEALQSHHYHIKWTSCSDLPCKLYDASVAVSSAGDNVYVTAGTAPDGNTYNNVYCYNTNTDHWTVLPQPGHRCGILHMLDDKLTIFGGDDSGNKGAFNKVTTYNKDTNSWYSEYPDMLNKRFKPGVITYNNYVIVMGGNSSPDNNHNNIEVMDYHNELQWKNVSIKLPVSMYAIKPTISGNNITIVGFSDTGGCSKECYQIAIEEILDQPLSTSTTSKEWNMMSPATYYDTATVPYSNPPVIIGGQDFKGIPTCDITLYNSSKNLWRKVDSLTSGRSNVGVALLNNNSIIVIGGCSVGLYVQAAMACSLTTVEIGNIVLNQ